MTNKSLNKLYEESKENSLFGRYICNKDLEPLLNKLSIHFTVQKIGKSVLGKSIYSIQLGQGSKKVLLWSQMHGNESTTTKALFDMLNSFSLNNEALNHILHSCTLLIVPILNPDGAEAYTRENSNNIDLNRDAQVLSQPESKVLRLLFEEFKPNFCYNLHGQRTIFSAGENNYPATLSFLAPAQDEELSITDNRKKAMAIIAEINKYLQAIIPNQVGIYDDAYNQNCVGDTFQGFGVPTILFEAGHFPNDYNREVTRKLIYQSLLISLDFIAKSTVTGTNYESYLTIPKNQKLFYDVIIRNAKFDGKNKDIAIQYQEKLVENKIIFSPKVEKIADLSNFFAHKEYDANKHQVFTHDNRLIYEGYENDFVLINNEDIALNLG